MSAVAGCIGTDPTDPDSDSEGSPTARTPTPRSRPARIPPWYPFQAGYCRHYGVQRSLVRVTDGVAAYWAACLQAAQPDRHWTVGGCDARDTGYGFYNHPVLQRDGHHVVPHVHIATVVTRAVVRKRREDRDLDKLVWLYDLATGRGRTGQSEEEPPRFEIIRTGPASLELWLPETLEFELDQQAFDTLDQRIAAIPGIDRVRWQDREIMLLDGDIDPDALAEHLAPILDPDQQG